MDEVRGLKGGVRVRLKGMNRQRLGKSLGPIDASLVLGDYRQCSVGSDQSF